MHWSQLVNTLTVGLNRRKINAMEADQRDPGQEILQEMAYASLIRKAARRFDAPSDLPTLPPAPEENAPYLPPRSVPWLIRFIQQNHVVLVQKCLDEARDLGWLLPPEWLPTLFNFALHHPIEAQLVQDVAGKRGNWLASQQATWTPLLSPTADWWDNGSPARRLDWFAHLRRQDPQAARHLLSESLSSHRPLFLAKLIGLLEVNLSPADEPLLISLQQHGRKEVRQASLPLLRNLPESALNQRMAERLRDILKRKRRLLRENLEVVPLSHLGSEELADGISLPEFDAKNMGQKAAWLCQMLASVPPKSWERHLDMKPEQAIQAALHHDWARPLLHGWMLASHRYQDQRWALAWLSALLGEKPRAELAFELQLPRYVPAELSQQLWALLDGQARQKLALRSLQQAQSPDSNLQIFSLILESDAYIPDPTADFFARQLYHLLQRYGTHMGYPFRSFLYKLPRIAALVRPDFYPTLRSVWVSNPMHHAWYDTHLREALTLLQARYRWFQAIQ